MQYVALVSFLFFLTVVYYCLFRFQEYNSEEFAKPVKLLETVPGLPKINVTVHSLLFPYNHHHFNCSAIISGNLAEIRRAERFVNTKLESSNWSEVFSNRTNCRNLIYPHYHNSTVELQFPLAFGIVAYKNPIQLLKLFRTLYRPWNYYCIHLDAKGKTLEPLVKLLVKCFPNFVIADIRENIKWGEMSLLNGALHCMYKLGFNNSFQWNYYLNIAGSDFPLKSNLEMVQYFMSLNHSSDIQDLKDDDSWKYKYSFKDGISKTSLDKFKQALKTGTYFPTKSPVPHGLVIHKGSFSGAFHRKFVSFILKSQISIDFKIWLNDTFIPDEAYWSTLYHGYYKQTVPKINETDSNFLNRYTHWGDMKPHCGGLSEHGLCIFGLYDLQWLVKKPHLFAHKFDENIQPITLSCIEEFITNRTLREMTQLKLTI